MRRAVALVCCVLAFGGCGVRRRPRAARLESRGSSTPHRDRDPRAHLNDDGSSGVPLDAEPNVDTGLDAEPRA